VFEKRLLQGIDSFSTTANAGITKNANQYTTCLPKLAKQSQQAHEHKGQLI